MPAPDRSGIASLADFSVKKFPAAALREKECAIASKRAARIAPQFRPASSSRGMRRSVVSLEEAQRSAAVAVCVLICPASLTSCLPPSSQAFPVEPQGSRLANRRQTRHVRSGASPTRPNVEWCLLAHQWQRTPRGQRSRPRPSKRAQPEHRRALISSRSLSLRAEARVAPYGCHAVNGGAQNRIQARNGVRVDRSAASKARQLRASWPSPGTLAVRKNAWWT